MLASPALTKVPIFCEISYDVAPKNDEQWANGFMVDHLSTKTTRVCRVFNILYQLKINDISTYASYSHIIKIKLVPFSAIFTLEITLLENQFSLSCRGLYTNETH